MEMLLETFSTLATAEYKIIDIHDSDYGIEETPSLRIPGRNILGSDPGHIYINCVDDLIRVLVTLRVWDSPPNKNAIPEWSEPEEAEFSCKSGSIYVDQWTSGPADIWHIPIPGDFYASVFHEGRDKVRQKAKEVRLQHSSMGQPIRDRVSRLHELDGTEKYMIDIWPLR